jgi:hypothetical protein
MALMYKKGRIEGKKCACLQLGGSSDVLVERTKGARPDLRLPSKENENQTLNRITEEMRPEMTCRKFVTHE